ncbi:MAG: restriction endonuclease subunit S [Epulopiscium sp.]|nr:restriction endonuclease subunit S [Candidatus Epulonipiscium sp.]
MVTYPYEWKELSFKKTINSVPFNIYLKQPRISGEFIVVQQGDSPIAGYANGSPYRDYKKVVLFGDHTLSLYKPSTPFFVATDGIRILSCKENIDRDYLYYFLQKYKPESEGYKRHFSILLRMDVFLPELSEQQAIASVLSDFDEHIDNLSELIEKKKAIRDGALEDLLSGRTRLDGFDGEWKTVSFNQVIKPKARIGWQGLKKDEYLRSGYSYLIGGTDFHNGTVNLDNISYVSKERYDMDSNIHVESNNVLVTKDGTIGKVALVPKLDRPATLNSGVFVFRTTSSLLPIFLYRVLLSSVFREFINTLSAGSTIKHLYQKDLSNFEFIIPQDTKEQEAIAEVLTAMDDEIESLETEKEKMMQIKEGAMDDLLTGRVRLKV